jgi:xanthine dehydrogenase molybdopterin-binding subunit B
MMLKEDGSLPLLKLDKGVAHDSGVTHVSGESEFVDDRPVLKHELHVGTIYSARARAEIKKIDFSKALQMPGVVGVYTYKGPRPESMGHHLSRPAALGRERSPLCR